MGRLSRAWPHIGRKALLAHIKSCARPVSATWRRAAPARRWGYRDRGNRIVTPPPAQQAPGQSTPVYSAGRVSSSGLSSLNRKPPDCRFHSRA
jgi:hypothetical protein